MPRKAKALATTDDFPPPPEQTPEFHPGDIEIVKAKDATIKVKTEKFMNEKVVVHIEPGERENDPLYLELGHNGINQVVRRGVDQPIKRKFLYSALMARKVTISNQFGVRDGRDYNSAKPSSASAYRIQLVRDDNPQGGQTWLRSVMAEAHGITAA